MLAGQRRATAAPGLAVVLALSLTVCSERTEDGEAAPAVRAEANWAQRLEQPSVAVVLEALAQNHRTVRAAIGPHRLTYEATFSLRASDETQPPVDPATDEGRARPSDRVHDTLSLHWASSDGEPPRFALHQENDHERGREVVVDGDRIYTRLRYRPWTVGAIESDIHELWLDDAQRAVYDVVELAAARLSLAPIDGDRVGDRSTLGFRLSLADTTSLEHIGTDAATWRRSTTITAVDGTITLDAASGAWFRADVRVDYSLPGTGGSRPGWVEVHAAVDPQAAGTLTVEPPADALERHDRSRLEPERERLLDGVAAP